MIWGYARIHCSRSFSLVFGEWSRWRSNSTPSAGILVGTVQQCSQVFFIRWGLLGCSAHVAMMQPFTRNLWAWAPGHENGVFNSSDLSKRWTKVLDREHRAQESGGRFSLKLRSDVKGIPPKKLKQLLVWGKFQVMPDKCRKFSRYDRKEFHLMTESPPKLLIPARC